MFEVEGVRDRPWRYVGEFTHCKGSDAGFEVEQGGIVVLGGV